eukprot:gene3438-13494_t
MDLKAVMSNGPLLQELSKEYELLKKSGALVDYDSWIKKRLRQAAVLLQQSSSAKETLSSTTSIRGGGTAVPQSNRLQFSNSNSNAVFQSVASDRMQSSSAYATAVPRSLVVTGEGATPWDLSGPLVKLDASALQNEEGLLAHTRSLVVTGEGATPWDLSGPVVKLTASALRNEASLAPSASAPSASAPWGLSGPVVKFNASALRNVTGEAATPWDLSGPMVKFDASVLRSGS